MTLATEAKSPELLGPGWCVFGQVATVVSSVHIDETDYIAAECFAESLRVYKESGMQGEQTRTLRAWAEYELKQGDRSKGEALWQEAQVLFEKFGIDCEEPQKFRH